MKLFQIHKRFLLMLNAIAILVAFLMHLPELIALSDPETGSHLFPDIHWANVSYEILFTYFSILLLFFLNIRMMIPGTPARDIHLADGSAFGIFEHVDITCPIIFTTAYDEYALQAFRVNSIAYLLKPIGSTDLQKAVDKLNLFGNIGTSSQPTTDLQAVMRTLKREESYKTHFLVPVKGDRFVPVGVEQISYFYIDGGAVKAVTLSGETFLFQQTLDELAEQLNPRQFFRANRQYIVAHKAVTGVSLWFGGRMVLQLTPPTDEKVLISKARVPAFREWF